MSSNTVVLAAVLIVSLAAGASANTVGNGTVVAEQKSSMVEAVGLGRVARDVIWAILCSLSLFISSALDKWGGARQRWTDKKKNKNSAEALPDEDELRAQVAAKKAKSAEGDPLSDPLTDAAKDEPLLADCEPVGDDHQPSLGEAAELRGSTQSTSSLHRAQSINQLKAAGGSVVLDPLTGSMGIDADDDDVGYLLPEKRVLSFQAYMEEVNWIEDAWCGMPTESDDAPLKVIGAANYGGLTSSKHRGFNGSFSGSTGLKSPSLDPAQAPISPPLAAQPIPQQPRVEQVAVAAAAPQETARAPPMAMASTVDQSPVLPTQAAATSAAGVLGVGSEPIYYQMPDGTIYQVFADEGDGAENAAVAPTAGGSTAAEANPPASGGVLQIPNSAAPTPPTAAVAASSIPLDAVDDMPGMMLPPAMSVLEPNERGSAAVPRTQQSAAPVSVPQQAPPAAPQYNALMPPAAAPSPLPRMPVASGAPMSQQAPYLVAPQLQNSSPAAQQQHQQQRPQSTMVMPPMQPGQRPVVVRDDFSLMDALSPQHNSNNGGSPGNFQAPAITRQQSKSSKKRGDQSDLPVSPQTVQHNAMLQSIQSTFEQNMTQTERLESRHAAIDAEIEQMLRQRELQQMGLAPPLGDIPVDPFADQRPPIQGYATVKPKAGGKPTQDDRLKWAPQVALHDLIAQICLKQREGMLQRRLQEVQGRHRRGQAASPSVPKRQFQGL